MTGILISDLLQDASYDYGVHPLEEQPTCHG